tara:strand:+ start:31 stop:729 length:699 start_codon:yes stop_codon:yes gene_type:complete
MATSGTTAFRPNVEEVIAESFERCGIDPQTRTGHHANSARRSLNLLFSEWANRGINYWAVSTSTLSLSTDTITYNLPAGVIDLLDVVIHNSADSTISDTLINRITIAEYNQIPNKTSSGKPSQYMIDKGLQSGSNNISKLYLWQSPDINTYVLNYWSINQLDDVTVSNEDTDIPYTWSECICAGLASKLAVKYAPDKFQLLNELYERAFNFAASTDNDGVSLKIQPTALNLI